MRFSTLLSFALLSILWTGCLKKDIQSIPKSEQTPSTELSLVNTVGTSTCFEDFDDGNGYDTILKPTILGYHLANHPYSVANMTQAYTNLYGQGTSVTVTHKYVRFKPTSFAQLSTLEDLNIDIFDYPLDYEVVQHGDYFNDGATTAEDIPWLYSVVPSTFTPPANITYEVLEQIHVPVLGAVENEAFRITGNPIDAQDCSSGPTAKKSNSKLIQPDVLQCDPGYHWDYTLRTCVEDNCPLGYHWDGTQCAQDYTPPPPPAQARIPSGTIKVQDNYLGFKPVRNVLIVAKRFLKIEHTSTNTLGEYTLNKEFNKVHLLVKFKNDQAKIRSLRRARLWQMLFPVEINLGKFKGNLNNLKSDIDYKSDARSDGARHWAAATANNNVQEYYSYATSEHIGLPPAKVRILLTNWQLQSNAGASPMFAKRVGSIIPSEFLAYFVVSQFSVIAGGVTALAAVLVNEVDVTVGYNANGNTSDANKLSETLFHELTHSGYYNKVGNSTYGSFVNAEISRIVSGSPKPYGSRTDANAGIIALGESWAYHIGHYFANFKYATAMVFASEQGITYSNDNPVANLPCHLNLLEDFNTLRNSDPFAWIPQGLYYDLMDSRNDNSIAFPRVFVNDQCSGYTNQNFFDALDADISNLQTYNGRLLLENGNSQSSAVNTIFTFYEQ